MTLSGIETLNVTAGSRALTIRGTDGPDDLSVTPTTSTSARITLAGLNLTINTDNDAALTIDPRDGGDTVTINGTSGSDTIAVVRGATTTVTVGALKQIAITTPLGNPDAVVVNAGTGVDLINVSGSAGPSSLTVNGGNPIGELQQPVADILNVITGAAAFTFLPGPEPDSGTFSVTGNPPISFDEIELLQVNGLTYLLPDRFDDPDLVFQPNNTIATATVLGSETEITLTGLTLHDTGTGAFDIDEDFYRITAHDTGKLIINAFFTNALGDVDIQVQDAAGNILAISQGIVDNEQLVIPVVAQQVYFLRVNSADGDANTYSLEIENFAAPVPTTVDLDPSTDSGSSDTDDNTFGSLANGNPASLAHIRIQADLSDFAAMGINIIADPTIPANRRNGAAVQVFVNGQSVGFATPIAGTGNRLYEFNLTVDQLNDNFAIIPPGGPARGWLNFVTAAVTIFDNRPTPAAGLTQLSEPLLLTFDPNPPAPPSTPDLLSTSDSAGCPGSSDTDDVTSVEAPAFTGTGEMNTIVRIYADPNPADATPPVLIGEGRVGSDNTDGVPGNGIGLWEVTVEPLADGTYTITATLEDLAGNISEASPGLEVTIDTTAPQRPTIDLADISDSGRNNKDNVTNDLNTPLPGFLRFRVTSDPGTMVVIKDGNTIIDGPFLMPPAGFVFRDIPTAMFPTDRDYILSAEANDLACNMTQSEGLIVEVDRAAPTAPTIELHPSSDSGVDSSGNPVTNTDMITNVTTPHFVGMAEADAIVRLSVVLQVGSLANGSTVAVPLDGNQAFPNGQWQLTSRFDLNDPATFAIRDGLRQFRATAEDRAGNISLVGQKNVFIDTQGPQIIDPDGIGPRQPIEIGGAPEYNLLAPILGQGPTPVVNSLIINLEDAPPRVAEFLYQAVDAGVALEVGHYRLVGDRSGVISIDELIVTNLAPAAGLPSTATIELRFNSPLPDDRYTLTVLDTLVDPAGNRLDGESNNASPTGALLVRTGDGVAGGNFVARFTVDSRVEIASVGQAVALLDINGNFVFDPSTGDFVNRDLSLNFGLPTDAVFAGQFTPPGVPSDGYDRLGAYGFAAGVYRWLLDFNNDNIPDFSAISPVQVNGLPFAGEFVGNPGDEIGLFTGTTWFIDTSGDNLIGSGDVSFLGDMRGLPIIGDFDGDGRTDLATHLASTNTFFFDLTSALDQNPGVIDGNADATINFGFGGVLERPFAGDFNLDGVTDIGLSVPSQNSLTPNASDWYLLLSNPAAHVPGTLNALFNGVFPLPGEDIFTTFGSNTAVPLVGNFRAPAPQFANVLPGAGVVGADAGGGPHVRVFDNLTGEERLSFMAYDINFRGGVRVASGDVNNDGVADVITGPGPGGGPDVKIFDGEDGTLIRQHMAFSSTFSGGVFVASGDIDGDGFADVIVGAGAGGGPHVRVFSGRTGDVLMDFMAFGLSFRGGVSVASGDVNRDGDGDVIVAAGPGGGPHVRVIDGSIPQLNGQLGIDLRTTENHPLGSFFPYVLGFGGGVSVAAGDLNGDGFADIITGAGAGGGPHVRAFSGDPAAFLGPAPGVDLSGDTRADLLNFFAFSPQFTGGVRVGAGDVNRDGQVDVFVTTGPGVSPQVRVISGTGTELGNFSAFGAAFTGGAFVSGGPMPGETLLLGGPLEAETSGSVLDGSELASIVDAAISRYEAAGLSDEALRRLAGVQFRISDLPGRQLGLIQGNSVLIDSDAAGRGWFVDETPNADEEYAASGVAIAQNAQGRVDLLSVILHEFGHHLGLEDLDSAADANRLMAATLLPSQRRLLTRDDLTDLDGLFTDNSLFETLDLD